jgi:predicted transcriptional regulator
MTGPEVSGDIHDAAMKLLEDPALLYHVHNATDDVVGEDENRVVLWLLAGISEPLQSVEIGGDSGSGKNRLADSVTKCFPKSWTEKYTTVSAKSIRYIENPIRTLYLAERPHKHDDEEESHTDLDIKLLISESGGLTPLVTIFDAKTGKPKSVPIKTSIQNVIMTTTDVSCAVELENRVWTLITDNSPEQNRRVLDRQGWLASGLPSQRPDYDAPKPIIQEVAFIIDKEAPKFVTIPYAQVFIDWVLGLQSETRARRDYLKILDLIKAIARAHYKQNPKIYDPSTKEDVIIATVEDFLQANRIGEKILTQTVTGINDRHMELYREACKLMDNGEALTVKTLTERMKRVKKRISAATVRRGIDVLVDAGLLRSTGTTQTGGKPADVYERNLDLNDLKEKKTVRAPLELITEITRSYETWCRNQSVTPIGRIPINPIDGKPIIIEKQETKPEGLGQFVNPRKLILGIRSKLFRIVTPQ